MEEIRKLIPLRSRIPYFQNSKLRGASPQWAGNFMLSAMSSLEGIRKKVGLTTRKMGAVWELSEVFGWFADGFRSFSSERGAAEKYRFRLFATVLVQQE